MKLAASVSPSLVDSFVGPIGIALVWHSPPQGAALHLGELLPRSKDVEGMDNALESAPSAASRPGMPPLSPMRAIAYGALPCALPFATQMKRS